MNKILTLVLSLLLFSALLMNGCSGNSSTGAKASSLVTVTFGNSGKTASFSIRQATLLARAELQLRRAWRDGLAIAAGVPDGVNSIRITVSAADMTTINRSLPVLAGQLEVTDSFEVPNGSSRLFTVEALNIGGNPVFSSQATQDLNGTAVEIPFDMQASAPLTGSVSFTEKIVDGSVSGSPALAEVAVSTIGLASTIITTTDSAGSFTLTGIPSGASFTIKMSKAGYADSYSAQISFTANSDTSDRPYFLYSPANLTAWGNSTGKAVIRTRVVDSVDLVNGFLGGVVITATDAISGVTYPVSYYNSINAIDTTLTSTVNGRFTILNIPAGRTVNVNGSKSGYTFNTRVFDVQADSVSMGLLTGTATAPATTPTPTPTPTIPYGITGTWTGTYSWNCTPNNNGSSPISISIIQESGSFTLSGSITYLGATTNIIGNRWNAATFNDFGDVATGTQNALGTTAQIIHQQTSLLVNNEFTGIITGDRITGTSLNGGIIGSGCSAAFGPAGTFDVTRQ